MGAEEHGDGSGREAWEMLERAAYAERVVGQLLTDGRCVGDAPDGKAWVVLHRGGWAMPQVSDWRWIALQLDAHDFETVRAAMAGEPSFVLFISLHGFVAVVKPNPSRSSKKE